MLDEAPAELIRLVGYLETMTSGLVIDLIAVSAYEVNGTRIMVPQRVEAERQTREAVPKAAAPRSGEVVYVAGGQGLLTRSGQPRRTSSPCSPNCISGQAP